jgi:fructokinase
VIASYGDAIIDLFALPIGSSIEEAQSFEPRLGGSTCNVAVIAARAGARVRFIGAVGPDGWGARIRAALERESIDVSTLVTIPSTRTPVTFCVSRPDGSRSFLSYRNGSADGAFALEHLAPQALDGVTWLHLASSSMRAQPRRSATEAVVLRAIAQGVSISVDLNVRPGVWPSRDAMRDAVRWLCARATMVKASDEDLLLLEQPATLEALRALAPRAKAVVHTRAEHGADAWVAGVCVHADAPSVTVVDSVGAGDAFVAALLAKLDTEMEPFEPTRFAQWLAQACRVGALAVTAVGATEAVTSVHLATGQRAHSVERLGTDGKR